MDHRFKTEYEKWCLLPDLTEEERKLLVSMTEEEQQEQSLYFMKVELHMCILYTVFTTVLM